MYWYCESSDRSVEAPRPGKRGRPRGATTEPQYDIINHSEEVPRAQQSAALDQMDAELFGNVQGSGQRKKENPFGHSKRHAQPPKHSSLPPFACETKQATIVTSYYAANSFVDPSKSRLPLVE
eukprot:TRINITY_DN966_c0_g1_i1.p1 TRINITY_DN966_c0_g1~~TRINITY_DN966_c0_g1_i1.p1  ORF type:complete len:123 (-),score=10.73 TRINITY_DN966_c0_g1_i1:89-457(-)